MLLVSCYGWPHSFHLCLASSFITWKKPTLCLRSQRSRAIPAENVLIRIPNWNWIHPNVAFLSFFLYFILFYSFFLLLLQGFIIIIFIIVIIMFLSSKPERRGPGMTGLYSVASTIFSFATGETAPLWFDRAAQHHLNIITRVLGGCSCCCCCTRYQHWELAVGSIIVSSWNRVADRGDQQAVWNSALSLANW